MTSVGYPEARGRRLSLLDRMILRRRLRRLGRRPHPSESGRWVPGELIVSMPQGFSGWEVIRQETLDWLDRLAPPVVDGLQVLLTSEEADDPEQLVIPETRLNQPRPDPLPRRYLVLRCPPGLEEQTAVLLRTLTEFTEPRFLGLRRRRRSRVLVARSSYLQAVAAPVVAGPVSFTPAFQAALDQGWLAEHPSQGARASVVMLDFGYPDGTFLDRGIQYGNREYPEGPFDGHATMVAAAILKLAPLVDLTAYRLQQGRPVGSAELLLGILRSRSCDLMVSSTAILLPDNDPAAVAERALWLEFVQVVRQATPRPMLVFPTGNDNKAVDIDRLAIPAGCAGAIAVGAIDPHGDRSVGSRTNFRGEDTPEVQWMVPGGSFPEISEAESLILVGGQPQAGTSVSAAFAAGMLACVVAELRGRAELDPRVQSLLQLADELREEAESAGHNWQRDHYLDGVNSFRIGSGLAGDPVGTARRRTADVVPLPAYDQRTWGEGVLHVLP